MTMNFYKTPRLFALSIFFCLVFTNSGWSTVCRNNIDSYMPSFLVPDGDHTPILLLTGADSAGVSGFYNWEFILSDTCNSTGNLSFNVSGNNTDNEHTESYALTDEAGEYLATSTPPTFTGRTNETSFVLSLN